MYCYEIKATEEAEKEARVGITLTAKERRPKIVPKSSSRVATARR